MISYSPVSRTGGTEYLSLYEEAFKELNPKIATIYAWSWMEEVQKGERKGRLPQ